MNKWLISFIVCLVLLIVSNIIWLYLSIDFGVTYSHQQVTLNETTKKIELMGELIVKGSKQYNKKDFVHSIREIKPKAFITEDDNSISTEGIRFVFEENKLVKIE